MHRLARNNSFLWTVQGVLAALFLFAGGFKLVIPADELAAQAQGMPTLFLRFIGTMEVLGALGLILPGLFRTQRWLTPLAAAGLIVIMIGATIVTALTMTVGAAILPFCVGLLAALVVYGRRQPPARQAATAA